MGEFMSLAHGQVIDSSFRPHPLLKHPHLQTLAPFLFRRPQRLPLRIERLDTDDGDFIDIAWSGEQNLEGAIAVLVHGLTGGFESSYLHGLGQHLVRLGWRVVLLQLRGAGEPNRTPRMYNHGDTSDLRWLWRRLREREPQVKLASVGWSLGGNVLLKALSEEGAEAPVQRAAAACVPFRLLECAERLRTGFSRLYQYRLLRDLKAAVRRKHGQIAVPPGVDLQAVERAQDFFDFDNAYTAPLNGYRDAHDYYQRAACGQYLRQIHVQTLVINALDDPFMTPAVVPTAEQLAPSVTLEIARAGGHVGFVAAAPAGGFDYWLDRRIADWLGPSH